MNGGHRFSRLGCCAVLFQQRGHLVLVVPFRPNERGALILTILRVLIRTVLDQQPRYLQMAAFGRPMKRWKVTQPHSASLPCLSTASVAAENTLSA